MISVIVCSNSDQNWDKHRRHVELTIGFPHEYIRIDNTGGRHSLCSAYNEGVSRAHGQLCVFMHEDVFFLTPAWGPVLWRKFVNPRVGMVGVAGSKLLLPGNPRWFAAGAPFIQGQVLHQDKDNIVYSVYSRPVTDSEVAAIDGLFMAIRKKLFESISFDEQTFDGFHLYDSDICMQVRRTHKIISTCDILVKHYSKGAFNEVWKRYAEKFLRKYQDELSEPFGANRK